MPYKMKNAKLNKWVREVSSLCQPDNVYWCDGSKEEYTKLMAQMVAEGRATPLKKRPNSFLFRSDPSDVARVESRTFISTKTRDEAGPTNNWINIDELKPTMTALYKGCMKGRTMYIIPFSMGPVGSPWSKLAVEITDSPYVVCNMHIMTRVNIKVIDLLNKGQILSNAFILSAPPWKKVKKMLTGPVLPMEKNYISHFPDEKQSGLMDRVMAAMPYWGKNVWLFASARRLPDAKGGWQNI